jgi:hypothetical protein
MNYNQDGLAFLQNNNRNQEVYTYLDDGDTNYISIPNKKGVSVFEGEFSLAMRCAITGLESTHYQLMHACEDSQYNINYHFLFLDTGGGDYYLTFYAENSAGNSDTFGSHIGLLSNEFINIVARITSSTTYLYMSDEAGTIQSESSPNSYFPYRTDFTNPPLIFNDARSGTDSFTYGMVQDVAMYNYDIGAEGANTYLKGGIPKNPSLYLPCNEGSGTEVKDNAMYSQHAWLQDSSWRKYDALKPDQKFY